jgi:hypothetical protein
MFCEAAPVDGISASVNASAKKILSAKFAEKYAYNTVKSLTEKEIQKGKPDTNDRHILQGVLAAFGIVGKIDAASFRIVANALLQGMNARKESSMVRYAKRQDKPNLDALVTAEIYYSLKKLAEECGKTLLINALFSNAEYQDMFKSAKYYRNWYFYCVKGWFTRINDCCGCCTAEHEFVFDRRGRPGPKRDWGTPAGAFRRRPDPKRSYIATEYNRPRRAEYTSLRSQPHVRAHPHNINLAPY